LGGDRARREEEAKEWMMEDVDEDENSKDGQMQGGRGGEGVGERREESRKGKRMKPEKREGKSRGAGRKCEICQAALVVVQLAAAVTRKTSGQTGQVDTGPTGFDEFALGFGAGTE
jgi:hypothetical protein